MAYEATEWVCGDTVTADKLNKLERGVQEIMSDYVPTNWQCGDIITAEKLNKLEQAVAECGGGGSSDVSIAKVTLIETATGLFSNVQFPAIEINDHVDPPVECIMTSGVYGKTGTANVDVVLYNGNATIFTGNDTSYVTPTVTSGNAEVYTYSDEWGTYADVLVKGDCTITYSSPT